MRTSLHAKFLRSLSIVFVAGAIIFVLGLVRDYRKLPEGSVRRFNRHAEPYEPGPLEIGGEMPGGPGDSTFAPYLKIPASQKFYVSVAEPDTWCSNEDCGLDGALIQTMGGWLQVENIYQSEIKLSFGLDLPEHRDIKSIVIIGDSRGRIVGIYPNKGWNDTLNILKNHPDLTNFNLLPGVAEFGNLKVGDPSPLQPGDPVAQMSEELKRHAVNHVPEDKAFYLFSLEKRKHDVVGMYEPYENTYACIAEAGCRYPDPDPPHDFLFSTIENLGGWFLASEESNDEMMKLFGLVPKDVASGKTSLVVLADASGIIVDLHPGKTLSDALTILGQHPELADVLGWYRN